MKIGSVIIIMLTWSTKMPRKISIAIIAAITAQGQARAGDRLRQAVGGAPRPGSGFSSNGLSQAITGAGLAPWAVIAGMMLMLIFLGIFVDQVSMMMITLPIFMPVVQALGVDLVWFGVLFLICMQMGLLLPPHGLLLMTMKGVAPPSVTMLDIFRAVVPFLFMSVLLLALVFLVPAVATWLPALIG